MSDDLEPLRGTYDWDRAFTENPGEPTYRVSTEQRRRKHHLPPSEQATDRQGPRVRQRIQGIYAHAATLAALLAFSASPGMVEGFMPDVVQQTIPASSAPGQAHRRRPAVIVLVSHVRFERGLEAA